MKYIFDVVALIILTKWCLVFCAFLLSAAYFGKKQKRIKGIVLNFGSLGSSIATAKTDKHKNIRGGGIQRCIYGVNKFCNNCISGIPSHIIRMLLYKHVMKIEIEDNVVIYKGTIFRDGYKCHIGKGTVIGDDNLLDARGGLLIGENCNLSTGVRIWTAQHDYQSEKFDYVSAPVSIGDYAWVSGSVTILPGVKIGRGVVIASGAVVTKDCEDFGVYGGIPAKKIGIRNSHLMYQFDGKHDMFL